MSVSDYRRDGYVAIDGLLDDAELARLRHAVGEAVRAEWPSSAQRAALGSYGQVYVQQVNLWRRHADVREFVLGRRLADLAAEYAGGPVRIWHDQALWKSPGDAPTPWHQDSHYWPHADPRSQITLWISLNGATTRNGCLAFIPGSQTLQSLPRVDLAEPRNLFEDEPRLRGIKPRVCELGAGSATLHNGLTVHFGGPNRSTGMREAFAIIYMPADTRYDGRPHVVTDPLRLEVGGLLAGEMFPLVSTPIG